MSKEDLLAEIGKMLRIQPLIVKEGYPIRVKALSDYLSLLDFLLIAQVYP